MVHAYRLVFPPTPSAPDPLWEWQQPCMDHLLWQVRTFSRQVELGGFPSGAADKRGGWLGPCVLHAPLRIALEQLPAPASRGQQACWRWAMVLTGERYPRTFRSCGRNARRSWGIMGSCRMPKLRAWRGRGSRCPGKRGETPLATRKCPQHVCAGALAAPSASGHPAPTARCRRRGEGRAAGAPSIWRAPANSTIVRQRS
jgi:hypothetical protein